MWLRVYARAAAGAFDGGPQPGSNRLVSQFGEGTHVVSMSFEGRSDIKNDDVVLRVKKLYWSMTVMTHR
jgi:hypothetical protein